MYTGYLIVKICRAWKKLLYLHIWYRWMRKFSENYILKNPQKSTLGKNNYMQISGRKSWILEFDLYLIIY